MGHATQADTLLEALGHKLGAIVADDPRLGPAELSTGSLQDDLYAGLCHRLADNPVNNVTAASIQDGAQVAECATDVEVGNVDVPVFVRLLRPRSVPRKGGCAVRGLHRDGIHFLSFNDFQFKSGSVGW
jgi:hypothetical protein